MLFSGAHGGRRPAERALIALGVVALLTPQGTVSLRAQQPPRLTLHAALELAARQNLDLAAARRRRAVALAGVRIARQRPNPSLSFTALRDEPHEGVFVGQPLEIGGKRRRRIDVARAQGGVTEVEIATLERQVRRSTREAFYRAALAHAETARLAEVLKLAQRLQQIAQQRFEAGDVAQLEATQAGLEAARAEADLEVARQREKVSLSQFNALLNEPATTAWELRSTLEDPLPPLTLSDLLQRADQLNPDLQHLAQEQKVEQSNRELLKAERIPNLDLELGTDFNAPRDFQVGPRSQMTVMLPLFTRNQGEIAQSLANQLVLESEATAARRAVAGRVESSYFDFAAQQTQVQLYRDKLVPVARQVENLAEESYRAGKANILSVIDAQRSVQDTERNYLESLFTLQSLFAELEETVGGPLD